MVIESASNAQLRKLFSLLHSLGIDPMKWKEQHGVALSRMSSSQCDAFISKLEEVEAIRRRFRNVQM